MNTHLAVSLTSQNPAYLNRLETSIPPLRELEILPRLLNSTDIDPLQGLMHLPDVLIHHLGASPERELMALAERPAHTRPTLLIIAKDRNATLMRLAMQAGARDFIVETETDDQLESIVHQLIQEKISDKNANHGALTVLINAKGGAGATVIAGNLAYILATRHATKTLLMDLDLQFGTQLLNLDLHPEQGLMEALERVASLDGVALAAYIARHKSGLHLLGTAQNPIILPGDIRVDALDPLLHLLRQHYQHVVIDLPRVIDPVMETVVESATTVIVVMQQYLSHIRDAKRLLDVMTDEIGISRDKIKIIVNRYQERAPITLADIKKSLHQETLYRVPNDYEHVNNAMTQGVPLCVQAAKAKITHALEDIADHLTGHDDPAHTGFFDTWKTWFQ